MAQQLLAVGMKLETEELGERDERMAQLHYLTGFVEDEVSQGWRKLDDVMTGKRFPHYWPFVRGIHQSPVDSPHKGPSNAQLWCLFCEGYIYPPVTDGFPSQKAQ